MGGTHVGAGKASSWQARGCANSPRVRRAKGTRVHVRRRSGHVQEHVVKSWIVGDAETAANDGLVPAPEEARLPGEPNVGTKVFVIVGDRRKSGDRIRQRGKPERIRAMLRCDGQIM